MTKPMIRSAFYEISWQSMLTLISLCSFTLLLSACNQKGKAETEPGLAGVVTSNSRPMEGVLVSAKQEHSTITTTVVSDASGRYSFPAGRLKPGYYRISIRAAGYDLKDAGTPVIKSGETAKADLRLEPTVNLAAQLTSAEWLMSIPGSKEDKAILYRCVACHDMTPIMQSHYDTKAWPSAIARMEAYAPPSVITFPVRSPSPPPPSPPNPKLVKLLASINLYRKTQWPFPLLTFARPSGAATKVIITEYDLPGPASFPHDAVVGPDGLIWYNDFQRALVGRLDPKSGQTKEWKLPILRQGYPEGLLTIKIDRDGNAWIPRFFQGCTLVRMNTKTEEFTTWTVPPEYNGNQSRCAHVALGKLGEMMWMSDSANRRMFKFDLRTGKFSVYDAFPNYTVAKEAASIETAGMKSTGHRTYGIGIDSKGNGYFADIAGGTIGEVDAQTGKVTLYPTPTPDSGPRRTYMDTQDRYWFGENYASKLGMFDTKTKKFSEWEPPTPWSGPYPAIQDKNGDVWTGGMSTDYVYRLNPETGKFTEYLLPTLNANIRKIDVDNSTNPVSIWIAEVHQGKLAKIEALP